MMRNLLLGLVFITLLLTGCGKKAQDLTIKIPLVTWGGYAALFAANNGAKANKESLFYKYGKFQVELIQEENPANQLQGFASGAYQIIWSTMDMLPLIYDSLSKDSRTIPQVIGLFDYSAGGDGIIVRGNINSGKDLKGKKIVTSQYTPSHYFLLWYLNENGMTTKDVNIIFAADAISAKDTFIANKEVDVCVTWSPFIYDITDQKKETYIKGSKLLTTSAPGNASYGLIADVYLARTDLVKNNPDVIKAFAKAMVEGYEIFLKDKKTTAGQIAELFGIKGGADEVMLMFGDVTIAGKAENKQFFDKNDKASAYSIFKLSTELYKKNGNVIPESFSIAPEAVIAPDAMLEAVK